jgi:TAG lipase/steryl ester hydrolase/phospholipase A2/LPA acyltransferase
VIKALVENNLLPRIISGSSSGSIIASMIGTTTDAELPRLLQENRIDLVSVLAVSLDPTTRPTDTAGPS